jgi:type IV pilus assembly protein PilO
MLRELRDLDFNDIGSAPLSVRYFILTILLVIIGTGGYFVLVKSKIEQLDRAEKEELVLRADFEAKQQKAANLEAYEEQLAEMQELLETMFRQLPSRTEMDKLLVDISQTALGAGIDVQLFQPNAEVKHDFYAERPITVRMLGEYHQFGEFVSGVASLPRVVILTMHDIALRRVSDKDVGVNRNDGRLILEGTVKTYRYVDEEEAATAGQGQAAAKAEAREAEQS